MGCDGGRRGLAGGGFALGADCLNQDLRDFLGFSGREGGGVWGDSGDGDAGGQEEDES